MRNELTGLNNLAEAELTNAVPAQYIAEDAIARQMMGRGDEAEADYEIRVQIPENPVNNNLGAGQNLAEQPEEAPRIPIFRLYESLA